MGVSELHRVRRRQILREVEGYLDLLMACEMQWSLTQEVRDRVARRALSMLDQIERPQATPARVLFLRGLGLRVMERYSDAVTCLQQAVELEPGNIDIWLTLGWCYKRCGRLDMAIQSLEEALETGSHEAILYYNLACYWSLAHNAKLALRYLAQAFDIDPNYRDLVADEADFDPIRSHPDFRMLTSVIV